MESRGSLFFDFDGTLTVHEHYLDSTGTQRVKNRIPIEHFNALLAAKQAGFGLFLCTGRARGSFLNALAKYEYLNEIPWDGMIFGASDLWYQGKRITVTYFSMEDCMKWIDYAAQTASEFHYNGIERWENLDFSEVRDPAVIEQMKEQARTWLKTNPMTNCALVPAVDPSRAPKVDSTVINMPTYSDIFEKGCNKGHAIARLCELVGLDIGRTVCFGDSGNDLDMFRVCPTRVCMAAAPDELKVLSTYVAKGNYGVAEGIAWLLERGLKHLL